MISEIKKGLIILKRDGPSEAILAGLRFYNINIEGYIHYYRYVLLTKYLKTQKRTCPFSIIYIDPRRITEMTKEQVSRWEYLGFARNGRWDQETEQIRSSMKFRSVYQRFVDGKQWNETVMYKTAFNKVKSGEIYWNGCRSVEDIEKRTKEIDQLYREIKNTGYKSQEEIHNDDIKSLLLSTDFNRSKEEVAIAIGRAGEFLFIDGNHRLAIAKALELEEIPVHVVFRHARWEEIRQEIKQADDLTQLDNATKRHINHPDVESLV